MAPGPPWLVSSFRFRARLGFSIPSTFSGPRGITPAFRYGAPHLSARGTSTLLSNALLSAHYGPLRLPAGPPLRLCLPAARWSLALPSAGPPRLLGCSFHARCPQPPRKVQRVLACCFPADIR